MPAVFYCFLVIGVFQLLHFRNMMVGIAARVLFDVLPHLLLMCSLGC